MPVEEDYSKQPESATAILSETKRLLDKLKAQVGEQIKKKPAKGSSGVKTAEQTEVFYRIDMWPLLSKIKAAAGDNYTLYITASEMHAEAMFSLGELYMWAGEFGRAIGMFGTAANLTDGRSVVAAKCGKALEEARLAYGQDSLWEKRGGSFVAETNRGHSFLPIIKWLFCGLIFAFFCIWGAVVFLNVFFAR
ncbi:MAG: hypothetical protein LBO03_03150 [Acidaminococcales bacterium]|nr:hypothetical protein [Acidaminococcales bacterium]